MTEPLRTCRQSDRQLPAREGRGRPRVYCSPACRNVAYEERRESARPAAAPATGKVVQATGWRDHSDMQTCVDQILDSPAATTDLMNQFVCRVATGHILEEVHYRHAVASLVIAYRMIARITHGDFKLPAVSV